MFVLHRLSKTAADDVSIPGLSYRGRGGGHNFLVRVPLKGKLGDRVRTQMREGHESRHTQHVARPAFAASVLGGSLGALLGRKNRMVGAGIGLVAGAGTGALLGQRRHKRGRKAVDAADMALITGTGKTQGAALSSLAQSAAGMRGGPAPASVIPYSRKDRSELKRHLFRTRYRGGVSTGRLTDKRAGVPLGL